MLPSCTSSDVYGQLISLNIPSDVANQLLDTQNGNKKTVSFSYNEIGQPNVNNQINSNAVALNSVAIQSGAESWLRYRSFKVGSMNQIRRSADPSNGSRLWRSDRPGKIPHRKINIGVI